MAKLRKGDIVQIVVPSHEFYRCLMTVDELVDGDVLAVLSFPYPNRRERGMYHGYVRLRSNEFVRVGKVKLNIP